MNARRLLLVWAVSVLVLTLAPFGPMRDAPQYWATLQDSRLGLFDLAANVLLFLPFGVLAVRAGAPRWAAFGVGFALSFGIEWTQQWIHLRHPASHDVVANTAGAVLGAHLSTPLLALGRALWRPRLLYVAGGVSALALAASMPKLAKLAWVYPYAVAVLGALVGGAVWRPATAFTLAGAGVTIVCAQLLWPPDPFWLTACLAGAVLGACAAVPLPACDRSSPS